MIVKRFSGNLEMILEMISKWVLDNFKRSQNDPVMIQFFCDIMKYTIRQNVQYDE